MYDCQLRPVSSIQSHPFEPKKMLPMRTLPSSGVCSPRVPNSRIVPSAYSNIAVCMSGVSCAVGCSPK